MTNTEISTCDFCDNEETQALNGSSYCDDCWCDRIVTCYDCLEDIEIDDSVVHDDEIYCRSCYDNIPACDHCGSREELYYRRGGDYCEACECELFAYCDECDEYVWIEDYAGDGRCTDCAPHSEYVQSYSTNVLNIHSPDKGRRLFGVELEVATQSDYEEAAETVYNLVSSDAILKEDSSIATDDYAGFEIVTRPMTFDNQVTFWDHVLDNVPSDLRSYDAGSCGLHIHVSRKSVSPLTIGKLLVFMNDRANEQLIRKIAQRYESSWARVQAKKLTDGTKRFDRYAMLNTQPAHTIEFRAFRGTLNKRRLLACLEFTATLIEFCEQSSPADLNSQAFTSFLMTQPKLKNLKSLLKLTEDNNHVSDNS